MGTRDRGNGRVKVAIGTLSSIANLEAPTVAELASLLDVTEAVRWDGLDFGVSESDQIDDRSLADDAAAQLRGFAQFGGSVPFFHPKIMDTGSVLRQAYELMAEDNSDLIWVERIGGRDWAEDFEVADNINVYRVMNDGFQLDTEGDGGYAYIVNLLPKGDVYPWTKVAGGTLALVGAATAALEVGEFGPGAVALRGVTVNGESVTARATWSSSDDSVVSVQAGVIAPLKAGTATVTATFPGTTGTATVAVTVS